MWSEDLYIKTISHDEIVPIPISKYLENFNVTRKIKKSSRRPKWLKENGKHYIYYHGNNGSSGMFRLNLVKNTNFGLYNKKSFLTHSKIVFGVTDHFCIK